MEDDPMAAILANLAGGLAAAESGSKDNSPLGADIVNLSSADPLIQERSIRDIINLTLHESNRLAVRDKDGIAPILKLLREGSKPILKTLAGHALANLALNRECRQAINNQNGISVLAAALGADPAVTERALAALCNLCSVEDDLRVAAARAGAIPRTLQVIGSSNDTATLTAALMFIANICVNGSVAATVGQDGGAEVIFRHLNSHDPAQRKYALFALSSLSIHPGSHRQLERAIGNFAQALRSADAETESKVLVAIVNLSGNDSAVNDFLSSGVIPEIVNRVASGSVPIQALAIQAIQNLAMADSTRVALDRAGAGQRVAAVLRQGNPQVMPHALKATINLCCDANIRKTMRNDGAIQAVQGYTNSSDYGVAESARQALTNLNAP